VTNYNRIANYASIYAKDERGGDCLLAMNCMYDLFSSGRHGVIGLNIYQNSAKIGEVNVAVPAPVYVADNRREVRWVAPGTWKGAPATFVIDTARDTDNYVDPKSRVTVTVTLNDGTQHVVTRDMNKTSVGIVFLGVFDS
jgi:hypothetical protein